MSNFKIKQSLKNKSILITFLIVCRLLISEKALAVWDETCCYVYDNFASSKATENWLKIYFKFFEYDMICAIRNSYLNKFEVEYSTNEGKTYTHLMSALTLDQSAKTWAWIDLKNKKPGSKIDITLHPYNKPGPISVNWQEGKNPRLGVTNDPVKTNQTWIRIKWYLRGDQKYITHIRVWATWKSVGFNSSEKVVFVYDKTTKKARLNSNSLNFSSSLPKQELRTLAKDYIVKVYIETDAIVVKGAFNEDIFVYRTNGALVKSMVADCDLLYVQLPANQIYIISIGQSFWIVAL